MLRYSCVYSNIDRDRIKKYMFYNIIPYIIVALHSIYYPIFCYKL